MPSPHPALGLAGNAMSVADLEQLHDGPIIARRLRAAGRRVPEPTLAEQIAECHEHIATLERLQLAGALCPAHAGCLTEWRARLRDLNSIAFAIAAE